MRPFAVCLGARDELCVVYANNIEGAFRLVETHLRDNLGLTDDQIVELEVIIDDTPLSEVDADLTPACGY